MTREPASDVLRWVREGEQLFGQVLQTLHRYEGLAKENQRLQQELSAIREEVQQLRAERVEAAETLKAFAEHVTQLATLALQRLGKRIA
jgi:predicted nuclease with TOPRIM domain